MATMKSLAVNAVVPIVTALAVVGVYEYRAWRVERVVEKGIDAAHVAEGLGLASSVKTRVSAYYDDTGRWPSSNEEAGLSPEKEYATDSISALSVSAGGVVTVRFTEKSGLEHGLVRLTPDASKPEIGTRWRCTTTVGDLANRVPQCALER